jgi:acyl-CoA synthetase (AMP-forming)/AMP-acid ligase II
MLRLLAGKHGDRLLVAGFGRTSTYREVEVESAELAKGLLAAGVGKGSRVGLLMPNSPDWAVAWLGALRAGALVTGISTFLRPRELAWVLRFADIDTLLVAARYLRHDYLERLEEALPGLCEWDGQQPLAVTEAPYLRSIWVWGGEVPKWCRGTGEGLKDTGRTLDQRLLEAVEAEVTPSDSAVVIFTSGSMADPKGVVHSHGTAVRHAYVLSQYTVCARGERVGVMTPFFWIGGMLTLLNTMIAGGALVCPEDPDPEYVLKFIRRERLDYLSGWAGQLNSLKEHTDFRPDDFSRLKPISATQARAGMLGPPLTTPPERIANSLGMSETFGPHSGEFPGVVLPENRVGSFGRAIAGIERKVVDPGGDREVPPGEHGELLVRGNSLMQGYYKRERWETFELDGFFRTSDLCSIMEDGHLCFHGRFGEMIKTSGANVSPLEVEQRLLSFADVLEAAVFGVPDASTGESVVAVVVPRPGAILTADDVRSRLKQELSGFKVPKVILFAAGDELPRAESGKLQKRRLKELIKPRL